MNKVQAVRVDADSFNDSQVRISCAQAIIDALGIFIMESEEIPVSHELIHDALMGASFLLKDASEGFCKNPATVATSTNEVTA